MTWLLLSRYRRRARGPSQSAAFGAFSRSSCTSLVVIARLVSTLSLMDSKDRHRDTGSGIAHRSGGNHPHGRPRSPGSQLLPPRHQIRAALRTSLLDPNDTTACHLPKRPSRQQRGTRQDWTTSGLQPRRRYCPFTVIALTSDSRTSLFACCATRSRPRRSSGPIRPVVRGLLTRDGPAGGLTAFRARLGGRSPCPRTNDHQTGWEDAVRGVGELFLRLWT
jgi:hypothetical protein